MIFDAMLPGAFLAGATLILMPRRLFFHFSGWVVLLVAIFLIDFAHPLHWSAYGNGYIFGLIVIGFGALFVFGAIAVKFLLIAFLNFKSIDFRPWPLPSVFALIDKAATALQSWTWALVLAFVALLFMRGALQGLPALGAYLVAFLIVAGLFVLARHTPPSVIDFLNVCARAFKWILLVLLILSAPMAYYVISGAEVVAGQYPYCIQVADHDRSYRAAQSKLDMSFLTMRNSNQFHALLIVDDGGPVVQILNWSYRMRDFDTKAFEGYSVATGIENRPRIVCSPKQAFARQLPIFFP